VNAGPARRGLAPVVPLYPDTDWRTPQGSSSTGVDLGLERLANMVVSAEATITAGVPVAQLAWWTDQRDTHLRTLVLLTHPAWPHPRVRAAAAAVATSLERDRAADGADVLARVRKVRVRG
jgi:hypothetical protein